MEKNRKTIFERECVLIEIIGVCIYFELNKKKHGFLKLLV